MRGIHQWPVNSLHKGPVTWEIFTFDDVFMNLHVTLHNAINVNIRSGQLNTMFHSHVHFQILTTLTYSQHILQGHVRGLVRGVPETHCNWQTNCYFVVIVQCIPESTHMVRALLFTMHSRKYSHGSCLVYNAFQKVLTWFVLCCLQWIPESIHMVRALLFTMHSRKYSHGSYFVVDFASLKSPATPLFIQ